MNSKTNIIALLALFASTTNAQPTSTSDSCLSVTTVDNFDVNEYAAAPWYVQQQAANAYTPRDNNRCVTAQYKIRDETNLKWWERSWWGYTVDVFNYAETADGRSIGGSICAAFDDKTPSQLTVAPCFLPQFFGGPYWVISYREGEDGYALVSGGQPRNVVDGEANCGADGTSPCCKTGDGINRSGLWILTRQRNPTESLVNEVRDIATQIGFSTSVLFNVTHDDDCQVPGIGDDDNSVRFLRGLN